MFNIDKPSIFLYVIIAFVIFMGIKIYSESDAFNLKCIISDVDGERYCVRERATMQLAADLLATVTKKLKELAYAGFIFDFVFYTRFMLKDKVSFIDCSI